MNTEQAEKWISASTSEVWRDIVKELKDCRKGFLADLLVKENPPEVDMYYKGGIFMCDLLMGMPEKAQKFLDDGPDEMDTIYADMDTTLDSR